MQRAERWVDELVKTRDIGLDGRYVSLYNSQRQYRSADQKSASAALSLPAAAAPLLGHGGQPRGATAEHGVGGIGAVRAALAGRHAREQPDPLFDARHRVDVEPSALDRGHDLGVELQVGDVRLRDHNALRPRETAPAAEREEALDLLVDAADRL